MQKTVLTNYLRGMKNFFTIWHFLGLQAFWHAALDFLCLDLPAAFYYTLLL